MKIKLFTLIFFLFAGIFSQLVYSQSLKDILNGLSSKQTDSTNTSSGKGSDILSTIGKALGAEVKYSNLVGNWDYSGPAVGFQSDNLLKKAGGAAAATALEKKIEPYYAKAGLTSVKIKFNEDSTFTMTLKKIKLSGTIIKGTEKNSYIFKFKGLGKLNLGNLTGYVVMEGNKIISLTFDATKLITLVDKVASVSGVSSLKTAATLLKSYDGCTLGFKLTKTADKI